MIGDAWTDLQAGRAAGVQKVGLVRTGRGNHQLTMPPPIGLSSAPVYDALADALGALIT
jgi:histidinol phosphatase-like enzyme